MTTYHVGTIVHCVKSVQMRSYFWSVFFCIRTEYSPNTGKYGPEVTLYLDTFHAVVDLFIEKSLFAN